MPVWLLIGIGGAAGSICRYWLGSWLNQYREVLFPLGTLSVNLLGCLILGLLLGLEQKQGMSSSTKLLVGVGFCGGFTTFSTFSAETMTLVQEGRALHALFYVGLSVILGFIACIGGYTLTNG